MLKSATAELELRDALMTAVVFEATAMVETVNVAVVLPAGTITEALTVAEALDDESATRDASSDALLASLTVPVEVVPPTTLLGARLSFVTDCGWAVAARNPARQNAQRVRTTILVAGQSET